MPYQPNLKACLRTLRTLFVFLSCSVAGLLNAEPTEGYAVMLTASVEESPAKITLHWEQDANPYANPGYTVYRKGANDTTWGSGTSLGNVLTYVDSNVSVGSAYEYQVVKTTTLGYSGYGYIFTGIRAETVPDSRGKIILLVDNTFTSSLAPELARLEQDLAGDGWLVIRHDVVRDDESIPAVDLEYVGFGSAANDANAAAVRNTVIADYNADPGIVKAVLLFGRIPIFRAGNLDIDGHLARPLPADGFYGDMDGTWTRATDVLPSDVDLQVGRVDLSRMTGKAVWNGPNTFPSELELLRQYLNKDHNFRHGVIDVQRQGIVGEGFGSRGGSAFGASGWRNFSPFFGSENITRATINTVPGSWQEIVCDAAQAGTTYLWAEGDGAGAPAGMGALGTHGQYNQVWTRDIVGIAENGKKTPDIKAVFTHFFGSWFGEWDRTDDLLRGVLASRTMALTASWSGVPHHYYHHMGLGKNIGYSMRLSQNNDNTLYKNEVQEFTRGVHIALMGDPTLRMHPVRPVTNLTLSGTGTRKLSWTASSDTALEGYHIYRSANASGPFFKLSTQPVTVTTFEDISPPAENYTYMVRAVKLESTPGGSYLNMSQGVFVTPGGGGSAPAVNAGPDRSTSLNGPATLAGSASDDDPITVTWSKLSGPGNVYFSDINVPVSQVGFQLTGTYILQLTANDGMFVSSDEMTVTVDPPSPNQPPLVYAGADQEITMPATALVSGTAIDDDPLTSDWSLVNGPGAVTFGDPGATSTIAAFSANGVYTLRLTADDGEATNSDDLVVTVNSPPSASPGTGKEFTLDTNTIALYHFNGNFNDASGNDYHLTPSGSAVLSDVSPGWMLVPAGEAAGFSNLGDTLNVSLPDSLLLPGAAADISIEAKIYLHNYKTDYTTPNAEILSLYQGYDAGFTIRDSRYHNPPGPSVFGANQIETVTSADWSNAIVTNKWYDLLITYEANGTLSCYLNGQQIGTSVSAPANTGRLANWTLSLGDFDGLIDELRISNVIRQPRVPATTFHLWQTRVFTPAEQQDPQISGHDADPDKDQIPNFLEFALALDPKKESGSGVLLSKEIVAGKAYLQLQYTRPANASDLTFSPQVSADLQNWNGEEIVEVETATNPDQTETVTVRDAISTEDAPRRFIQMKVHWGDLE